MTIGFVLYLFVFSIVAWLQHLDSLVDALDGNQLDAAIKLFTLKILIGNDGAGKSEACRLLETLLQIRYRTALARKTDLADGDKVIWNYAVGDGGDHGKGYCHIHRRLVKTKSADYVIKASQVEKRKPSRFSRTAIMRHILL